MYKPLYILLLVVFCGCSEDIPNELDNAMEIIEKEWPKAELETFKSMEEEKAVYKEYRLGMGIWLRNNLLKQGSRLYQFFRSYGILNREDMSEITIRSLHRKLNNKSIELNRQIEDYTKFYLEDRFQKEEKKK